MLDPKSFGRVAVLYGGYSSEREISLQSGSFVVDSLEKAGVDVFCMDVKDSVHAVKHLCNEKIDCAFIALHGKGGEDGTIQAVLEALRIPYTGSGVLSSSLAMNKLKSKCLWNDAGLPTPPFIELVKGFDSEYIVEILGLPLAVKPITEGSSIGISYVNHINKLLAAWEQACNNGNAVIAEKWIHGEEYAVGFVADTIFEPIQVQTNHNFYDYSAKYKASDTQYICPVEELNPWEKARLQTLAYQAAETLDISGWGRIDIRHDKDDNFWLLEANTVPGMTTHSLIPMAAKASNIDSTELMLAILATSRNRTNGTVA